MRFGDHERMRRLVSLLLVLLLAAPALAQHRPRRDRRHQPPVPKVGDAAPALLPLEALHGTAPASLKDRVTVLAFFALWCPGCRNELPVLAGLHRDYEEKGLEVVTVSIDRASERAKLVAHVKKAGVKHTVLLDPDERLKRVWQGNRTSMPYLVVIDRAGVVRRIDEGFDPAKVPEVRRQLEGLLKAP